MLKNDSGAAIPVKGAQKDLRASAGKTVESPVARLFENSKRCEEVVNLFSFFSNRTRFKILCVLNEEDFSVSELSRLIGGKISNVCQQLKILTLAGFLDKRRRDKSIYYHLKDQRVRKLLQYLYAEYVPKEP